MTDKTSTQNLTRTQVTDNPRRMAEYLRSLALDADLRMAAQWRDLDRSRTPAFAKLRVTTPYVFDDNAFTTTVDQRLITFDTVEIDTTGKMADLAENPNQIKWAETGWYLVGGGTNCSGFGSAVTSDVAAVIRCPGLTASDYRHDGGFTSTVGSHAASLIRVTSIALTGVTMEITWNGSSAGSATNVYFADLYALKVGDL